MGNANGDYEVNGDGAVQAREDLVAEGSLTAMRIGDHEKSLLSVDRSGGSLRADARALEGDWRQGAQAKKDEGHDREPNPTQHRWV
jgi:hypothetical protein